jgi:NADPH:quinone reductase-like Zn-dependent oxidoreductase
LVKKSRDRKEIIMTTAKIVRFKALGGPDVLEIEDLPLAIPGAGEVRFQVEAIGLNRAEVMFRTGHYLEQPEFPSRIGVEAAGIVDAIGPDVVNVQAGDRVSVASGQSIGRYGTYGESAIALATSMVKVPDNVTATDAAAAWIQYLTAYFAFVDLASLKQGQAVLITAATGGAGLGAVQMAKLLGATTIATTRTQAKKAALTQAGADHVIVSGEEDLVARVKEITGGKGADVIFDPVAGNTLPTLAEAVAWGGQIILYGALGGVETPYPLWTGFARNFSIRTYMIYNYCGLAPIGLPRNEEAYRRAVAFINDNLASGKLKPVIAKTFPLSEVREAHRYMESNEQLGKIIVTV